MERDEFAETVDLTAWELCEPQGTLLRLTLCYEDSASAEGRLALVLPAEAAKHLGRTLLRAAKPEGRLKPAPAHIPPRSSQ